MSEDYDRFKLWYVEPLHTLYEMSGGQGGFIALATSCFLYERHAIAVLQRREVKAGRPSILQQLSADFGVEYKTAEAFWDVVRDGLLHQAMPIGKKFGKPLPRFASHHVYPTLSLETIEGVRWLKVQPWKFMDRVLELWDQNFELLRESGSFPWAIIGDVPS